MYFKANLAYFHSCLFPFTSLQTPFPNKETSGTSKVTPTWTGVHYDLKGKPLRNLLEVGSASHVLKSQSKAWLLFLFSSKGVSRFLEKLFVSKHESQKSVMSKVAGTISSCVFLLIHKSYNVINASNMKSMWGLHKRKKRERGRRKRERERGDKCQTWIKMYLSNRVWGKTNKRKVLKTTFIFVSADVSWKTSICRIMFPWWHQHIKSSTFVSVDFLGKVGLSKTCWKRARLGRRGRLVVPLQLPPNQVGEGSLDLRWLAVWTPYPHIKTVSGPVEFLFHGPQYWLQTCFGLFLSHSPKGRLWLLDS